MSRVKDSVVVVTDSGEIEIIRSRPKPKSPGSCPELEPSGVRQLQRTPNDSFSERLWTNPSQVKNGFGHLFRATKTPGGTSNSHFAGVGTGLTIAREHTTSEDDALDILDTANNSTSEMSVFVYERETEKGIEN